MTLMNLEEVTYRLTFPLNEFHQYQGKTNDCGPTSLAIAANAYLGEERYQGTQVAEAMNRIAFELRPIPHLVVRRIRNWATFPWGIAHYLREIEIPARWAVFTQPEQLLERIQADRLTMVIIGEPWKWKKWKYKGWSHIKLLYGYTPGRGYLFVDPGSRKLGDEWKRAGFFWQGEEDFLRLWRNMGRIRIEVG
jgi:hypothetical protein